MDQSLFYRPGVVLSQPELGAARLDGLLIEVGEGYIPADLPDDPGARATALAPILSPGYAASGPTAAWVLGIGAEPPRRHHISRVVEKRPRIEPRGDVIAHDARVPADELILISAIPVTTLLRTLTDLVLTASRYAECAVWMRRTAEAHPALVLQVQTHLAARTRMPGKRAALAAVSELVKELPREASAEDGVQDDVTRYTS